MAHVASNTTNSSGPSMDRMTHAVIKETSKNLRYYIDVKRRENAFVLNPKSTAFETAPVRARFLYGAYHQTDPNFKHILPTYQQKPIYPTLISPERQMCREELNFHMRTYKLTPKEYPKFPERRLRLLSRSSSSCSGQREVRPRSAFKISRHEKDQLVDDAANLLANMVKTRQSIYDRNSPLPQTPLAYIRRSASPSPRPLNDAAFLQSLHTPSSHSVMELRPLSILQTAHNEQMSSTKPMKKGFLCQYKVSVTTGNCNGASTQAPIRMKFCGSNGCTDFHELIESETHRVPFIKDQTDVFTVQTYHVGQLTGVIIGHDQKDMRSSWFLEKISVDDPVSDTTYGIACNTWLSVKSTDRKTMRDFHVTSVESHKERADSDYSTTITDETITLNRTTPDESEHLSSRQRSASDRKQQHVTIGPTTVAKKPPLISVNPATLAQTPTSSSITIETPFNRGPFVPTTVPVRRFHSPGLSTTSSDTELREVLTNETSSTTPTPTLNRTGLQSISEHGKLPRSRTKGSINRERPPARLEQRQSLMSTSSERSRK